jgi:hypothetical protein
MFKIITYILLFIFLSSCAGTFDSVKRGLTGQKKNSADEFLVKKKDPLILPPDFENLPVPDDTNIALEEDSIFQETVEIDIEKDESGSKSSVESSILKKIQTK